MKRGFIPVLLSIALVSLFPVDWAVAQGSGDPVGVMVSVPSDFITVGDEFALTLTVTGGEMPPCISAAPQPADVVLVIDVSGSMNDYDKLDAAKQAALTFIDQLYSTIDQVAIVGFSNYAFIVQDLTSNMEQARTAVDELETLSGTDIAGGLQEAVRVLTGSSRRSSAKGVVVLLSDGQSGRSEALLASEEAQELDITIYTISLGSDADRQLMEDIATGSYNHYHSPTTAQLNQVYELIQTQIAYVRAEGIVLEAGINTEAVELIPDSVSVAEAVVGDQVRWQIGELSPGEEQMLSFRLRVLESGIHPVFVDLGGQYEVCDQSYELSSDTPSITSQPAPTPTPTPSPTPTLIPPCTTDPLGDECLETLFFLGELTWPCREWRLPWWVCLLLLLLLLLSLLLWWLWQRIERQRRSWAPSSYSSPPQSGVNRSAWPSLPTYERPAPIPVVESPVDHRFSSTLVIGLGDLGKRSLEALEETLTQTYGEVPEKIHLLSIDFTEEEERAWTSIAIPLHEGDISKWLERDSSDLPGWIPSNMVSDLREWANTSSFGEESPLIERMLGRLAILMHRRELEARIGNGVEKLAGENASIFLVGSLAEGYASGALFDVGYLVRQQLKDPQVMNCSLQSLVFLPEAHIEAYVSIQGRSNLQRVAAGAWRELDRFQMVFEHAYPVECLDQRTEYEGKLFDRCYLLSPDRSDGISLTDQPIVNTICPAIADVIITFSDSAFRPTWEEIARAVTNQVGRWQVERGEVLYSSLGSFAHILPVEDLMQSLALQMADDVVELQLGGGLGNPEQVATRMLSQPESPTGMFTTELMHDLSQCATLPDEQILDHLSNLGVEAYSILAAGQDEEMRQSYLETLHNLVVGGVWDSVKTSTEARAAEYGPDTRRLIKDVDRATDYVDELARHMAACSEDQAHIFQRVLIENMLVTLNANCQHDEGGLLAGLDLSHALLSILTRYHQVVKTMRDKRTRELNQVKDEARDLRDLLEQMARDSQARHPSFWKALLVGVGSSAVAVLGLGLATLAAPALFAPLGGAALLAAGAGAWGSWHMLSRKPALIQRQEEYLVTAQEMLALEIECGLYDAWTQIVDRWIEITRSVSAPLESWKSTWRSPELQNTLLAREKQIAAKREARQAIAVRHYLEDERIRRTLYEEYVAPRVQEDEQNRFLWAFERSEDDQVSWTLEVVGSCSRSLKLLEGEEAAEALLDIGSAYASELRSLTIADVLAENYSSSTVAEEIGSASAPFIKFAANKQSLSESHRFVAAISESQRKYFKEIVKALRQPAAQSHSQQLAPLMHPHRCITLASLDLLRTAGLPSWNQARRSYGNLRRRERAALHVFPAEQNAALYEGLLSNIDRATQVLSPQVVLTLEDEQRGRAFWMAYALGWVRQRATDDGGMSTLRHMALVVPGTEPIRLTDSTKEKPSLWQAAVSFVLGESGGDVQPIESAVEALKPSDRQERRARESRLIQALDEAREMQRHASLMTREMGLIMHLVVEDVLRQWLDEEGFLEV